MSHITTSKAKILDLDALDAAVQKLGGRLADKQQYNWYSPNPNKCHRAIQLPGVHYEVGVMQHADGHYELACDFYGYDASNRHDGHKLAQAFGLGLSRLELEYQQEVVRRTAMLNGWSITESVDTATGEPIMILNQY